MVSKRKKVRIIWRRTALLRLTTLVSCMVILAGLLIFVRESDLDYMSTHIMVFSIVNISIIALGIMAFLIGRNIVKLLFERKNRIVGAKLRLRLVLAFLGLTLVPTCLVFVMASNLMSKAMDSLFSNPVEELYQSASNIAKLQYKTLTDITLNIAKKAKNELSSKPLIYTEESLRYNYLEELRKDNKLFSLSLYDREGNPITKTYNVTATIPDLSEPEPDSNLLNQAVLDDKTLDNLESVNENRFVRVYLPFRFNDDDCVIVATYRVNPQLTDMLSVLNNSFKEHEQVKLFHRPLQSSYVLIMALVTAIILFSAIWVGFYIARSITGPIQRLAEGTKAVAKGNYDFKLREVGDDELSSLVKSFNIMTQDLKLSRLEIENRRLYLEAILERLALGVIALDSNGRVTSVNQAAFKIFGISNQNGTIKLSDFLAPIELDKVESLLRCIDDTSDGDNVVEQNIEILSNGRLRKVIATAGHITDVNNNRIGCVLIFDDVTDLVKAQQSAAWGEVARRIAHEIKNPLTPIQLSAQRMLKILKGTQYEEQVQESTQMIIEHVNSIKRLTDEFAKFARMPPVEMKLININALISEILAGLVDQHQDIVFQFIADNNAPDIPLDREQIRRVLINLIDNGMAACRNDPETQKRGDSRIVLKTEYKKDRNIVVLEVADNGPGIPASDRKHIFEPYMTTKVGGTGLGLAIVASVLAEHKAEIKVFDNKPYGTRFVIELKVFASKTTHNARRLNSNK